jgi:EAL domain-containing protein (putative c-di-GMP-specific phosphodiesterase class I)
LPPQLLTLEITEANLAAFRRQGYRQALDDCGISYSSLSSSLSLRPDEIKIDKGFVLAFGSDALAEQIVAVIASMATHMDLLLVAEGVDNAAILSALQELGIPLFQGYHVQGAQLRPCSSILVASGKPRAWMLPARRNCRRAGAGRTALLQLHQIPALARAAPGHRPVVVVHHPAVAVGRRLGMGHQPLDRDLLRPPSPSCGPRRQPPGNALSVAKESATGKHESADPCYTGSV